MSSDTLSPKQMDAAAELVRQDDAAALTRAFQQKHAAGIIKSTADDAPNIRVAIMKGGEQVYSQTFFVKAEGDMSAAISEALSAVRQKVDLPFWGWTLSVDKA
jgi:hypothetical protein